MNDLCRLPWNFPSMAGHLWFMYPLISLYLIIPVVSPWLEKASAKDERLFLYIFVFSTTMPWLHRFVSDELWGECFWNGFHALWYCSGYLGYLVLAHYIRYHLKWTDSKRTIVGRACFIIGAAFTAIVTALVDNIISPIIGMFVSVDFNHLVATVNGVELQYGAFIMAIVNFVIVALVLFCIIKAMNKAASLSKKDEEEEE